ncbi:AI-2E family transporter [Marivita sp. S6314]|uniref:AI-2E family transporter n=1 Tax=Marivita sp. S6314 TaxID=2926406 RepID=UPI001FF49BE6|nr:AI-2E family transporter [Marivita sp. S6314]MCK0149507.1 AI-2E family transporter [Marivita sp. S6314]
MQRTPSSPVGVGWSLLVIAIIASVAALKLAKTLLAPIVLGLVIAVVLAPLIKKLSRIGIPVVVSAFSALVMSGVLIAVLLLALGPVISELIDQVPRIQWELRGWLQELMIRFRGTEALGQNIGESLGLEGGDAVESAMPSVIDALWMAPNFMAQLLVFGGTLFFFLLTRDDIYALAEHNTPALRQADRAVSHYFVTITAINAGLGLAVFGVMSLIGLSNPVLWGAAAFLLNFVLYLGPISLIAALAVAGLIQFNGAMSLVPPFLYFLLNLTEAQFVTPSLVGQRLRINPLCVFLSILFGLWLWGPTGGIVSLPVLVWVTALTTALRDTSPDVPDTTLKAA